MSARKSRVRPVPDFSRAHQLLELQLEARKKDMKKCTKVEEFNLSRGFVRGDGSSATPIQGLDISKPSPRLPYFQRLQTNQIQSPFVSSSDVMVPKPTDCTTTMNWTTGLQRKAAAGILKNAGKTDEVATGHRQTRCAGATLGRRPRVTFDIASPLRESPISMPRRVRVSGWSCSPSKMASPRPAASRILIACNRIPVEPRNRITHSTRSERSQPRRVYMFGSSQRLTTSQSCSRAACMGGFARFRAGSIAKAIDFNEGEEEEDGKSEVQDASENAEQPVETTAIGVNTMNKKFRGLKNSPVRKIHVDVAENDDASMSSPLLRFNTNSDGVIRSPLLRKMERIGRKDAKNRSRLPQPKDLKRKADKENRSLEMKRKSRDDSRESTMTTDFDQIESTECRVGNSQDQRVKLEANSRSGKREALEQMETRDAFDANETISKLEKKAQRLRRRSQLTEEKSEQDYIMKKLEVLQRKIESMRMVFHSMCHGDSTDAGGDGGSYERGVSTSDDLESGQPMVDESNVCPTESRLIDDARPDVPAVESKGQSESSEETFETTAVTSDALRENKELEFREDNHGFNAMVPVVSEIVPELTEESQVSDALVRAVSESALESRVDELSDLSLVTLEMESELMEDLKSDDVPRFVSEIELRSANNVLHDVKHVAVKNEVEEGLTERQAGEERREMESEALRIVSPVYLSSDIPTISPETESQSKAEFENDVADISVAIESRSEDDPRVPLPTEDSESKENVDPLSNVAGGDVSANNSIQTGVADNPLRGAEPSDRVIFQDITEEIQSRATQFHGDDDDDGIFVVEESSDDSDLMMNSEDFTEWSSSPIALMNQCLTNIESDLSSELSAALSPEDVLVERVAKFSISDRLDTSNVEASPNMSSEFTQYSRYEWREGVDGGARLFNPVAAALNVDAETDDDAHFVPISPSPESP